MDLQGILEWFHFQWQSRTHSKWYLLYRWIIGLYFLGVVVTALSMPQPGKFWFFFIYLTNWGIMLCAATTLYAAVLVSIWYCHPKYTGEWRIASD